VHLHHDRSAGAAQPGRWRHSRMRLLVGPIAPAVLAAAGGWVFVWPPTDPPGRVDAVLVLAGGRANGRLPASGWLGRAWRR
jgi:hypothetical protein